MGEKFILDTKPVITDQCGEPVSCGEILFVAKGTNTPITIYGDECMKVPTTNPRTLDQYGSFSDVYVPSDVDFDVKIYDDCGCHIGTIQDASTSPLMAPIFTTLSELRAYCGCTPYAVYAPEGGCPVRYRRIETDPLPAENLPDTVVGVCYAWQECEFSADNIQWDGVSFQDDGEGGVDFAVSELPDGEVLSTDRVYIRRGSVVYKFNPQRIFTDLCLPALETVEGSCSLSQLVLATDSAGCSKLAVYSASNAAVGSGNLCDVVAVGAQTIPADPTDDTTYYEYSALDSDNMASSLDETLLDMTKFQDFTITVSCPSTRIEFDYLNSLIFEPSADSGAGRAGRVVGRIDDDFILTSTGSVSSLGLYTNFERSVTNTFTRVLNAGTYRVRLYVVAENATLNIARINANCTAEGASSGSITARISV